MHQKQISFFIKKRGIFLFFAIPLLIIIVVVVSIGVLVATGWYTIDYQIAKEFAKGLTNELAKYWVRFYDQLGNTELIVVVIIYLAILIETWFLLKINQKKMKFEKYYWITTTYYLFGLSA
ncbi:hypothetical protein [Spiroplasma endosymbiont of Glossina fuscipes fuscipes]|uniref:hypothetical protein n=1 Tax=Spiroplasma endosymbiont of Glossina fuscipes fuscipes TaxID=2004463 RepID=UPI003C71AA5B